MAKPVTFEASFFFFFFVDLSKSLYLLFKRVYNANFITHLIHENGFSAQQAKY